jgi:hypothetical protein
VKRILDRDVLPAWRHQRIAEITRRQILELIDGIADRGRRHGRSPLPRASASAVSAGRPGGGIIETSPMAYLAQNRAQR